jgi:trehalose synthase
VMVGAPELWEVTKAIHNLLQGATVADATPLSPHPPVSFNGSVTHPATGSIMAPWTEAMTAVWRRYNELTAERIDGDYDFVVVHDPQPAGVLSSLRERSPQGVRGQWVWRCHIDLTRAQPRVWDFLRPYLAPYDAAIFTMQGYVKPDIPIPLVVLIAPAIDPLSSKNVPMSDANIREALTRYDVNPDFPLICQVSRFDPWKDPLGVIDVYRRLKRRIPHLQLALVGSMAADDPEGWRYYELTARHAGEDMDIHLLTNLLGVGNAEVNAFQRASSVLLQKSIREGFALSVSEAMWKERPVVATAVGGIPLQVASGQTGFLVNSTQEAADRTLDLIRDPDLARSFGQAGRERVCANFLITRDLGDYLQLFHRLHETGEASSRARAISV